MKGRNGSAGEQQLLRLGKMGPRTRPRMTERNEAKAKSQPASFQDSGWSSYGWHDQWHHYWHDRPNWWHREERQDWDDSSRWRRPSIEASARSMTGEADATTIGHYSSQEQPQVDQQPSSEQDGAQAAVALLAASALLGPLTVLTVGTVLPAMTRRLLMVVILKAMATSRDWKRALPIYLVIRLLYGRTAHGAMSSSGARMSTKPRSGFRLRVLYVARFGPAGATRKPRPRTGLRRRPWSS